MNGHRPEDAWTTLYRVHWMEEGEQKKSSIRGPRMAFKHMESLLQRGIASWMVPVPMEDDDIPF
jgi:hypothetical protein